MGLLIVPEQKYYGEINDDKLPAELLIKAEECIVKNTYKKKVNLQEIARHMRNAIARARFELKSKKQPRKSAPLLIHSVAFTDRNESTNEEFEMEIPYKLLEEFFFAFADAIIDA